jgi:hypothetical protein
MEDLRSMEVHSIHEGSWQCPPVDGGHSHKDLKRKLGDVHALGHMVPHSNNADEGKTLWEEGVEAERKAMAAMRSNEEDTSYSWSSRSVLGLSTGSRMCVSSSALAATTKQPVI